MPRWRSASGRGGAFCSERVLAAIRGAERGNYKIVARLFSMEARDYKRFLNFLRKHDCQIPFKDYR
jgi:hypothetical protein